MFGTIRKHSQWMWMIIITVIVISFVVFFTPGAFQDSGRAKFNVAIDGRNFTQDQLNAADREVRVGALLGLARRPESNDEATQRAFERLLLTAKLEQYGILVGPEATARWIRDRIMRDNGPFAGMTFEQVAEQFIKPAGLSAEDLTRFARHQAGLEVLLDSIGSPASLITPQEVEAAYLRDNEKLEVEVAFVANSNFLAKVTLDPAEVTKFYSNTVANYRSPDRVQVHYVRLATSNYVAAAESALNAGGGLEESVNRTYLQQTNFYAGVAEAEAKQRIKQSMIDQEALKLAKRKAYDFINKYYESPFAGGAAKAAELLGATAKAEGLEMKTTNPFAREERPADLAVAQEFADAAFDLSNEDPLSTAVSAPDGYYALCFDQKFPGTFQPLEQVKEKVEKDFRADRARTLAREAMDKFHQAATNTVAGAQSFSALAELSGFTVARIPALTLRTTTVPGVTLPADIRTISAMANNMETNTVGRPQFAADGWMIVRTGARTAPTAEETAAGLVEYRDSLRRARESEMLSDWVMKQVELSGLQAMLRNPAP